MNHLLLPLLAFLCVLGAGILYWRNVRIRKSYLRMVRDLRKQLDSSEETSNSRANALDYIVRSRVVDYQYDYYGYEITMETSNSYQISRRMTFGPPRNKDIICKLIILCEHGLAERPTTLQECGFTAAVYAPDRNPVEYTIDDPLEDESPILGWDVESHPWLVEVTDQGGKRVKVIIVFIPMITETRKLELAYSWNGFFPEFKRGETRARASLSLIKPTRVLEILFRTPECVSMRLALFPPDNRDPITSESEGPDIFVRMENAPRGDYRYEVEIIRTESQ